MARAAVAVASVLALAIGLAACGGSEEDPRELLRKAYSGGQRSSATVDLQMTASLGGLALLSGPLQLTITGPIQNRGHGRPPVLDWRVQASAAGQRRAGGLTVTDDNAFVTVEEDVYEVGEQTYRLFVRDALRGPLSFGDAGVEPIDWVREAEIEDGEEIDGTQTRRVHATVDPRRVVADLNRLAEMAPGTPGLGRALTDEQVRLVAGAVDEATVDSHIDDQYDLRGVDARIRFTIPAVQRDALGGVTRGTVVLRARFTNVGEPVRVQPPEDAQPLQRLLERLGLLGSPAPA